MSDLSPIGGRVDYQGTWGGMMVQDGRRIVRFQNVPKQNMVRTEQEGRPIFEAQIVLFVRHAGERDETAVEKRPHHEYEFPREWAAFEAGNQVEPNGTPLSILFPTDPHIVAHLRGLHFFTVEQLAQATEEGLRRIGMGARDWHSRSVKFIEASEKAAPLHQMHAELTRRDEEIQALKDQVAMLAEAATRRPRRRAADEGDE